jgi:glycogen operon protein
MAEADWQDGSQHAMAILFDMPAPQARWLLLLNAQERPQSFVLPPGQWRLRLATDGADEDEDATLSPQPTLPPVSLWVAQGTAAGVG